MKKLLWILFILLAIVIGLYPFLYLVVDMRSGFLSTKPATLLQDNIWNTAFYLHIIPGAIALLTGWSQFSRRIRNKNLNFHRTLGKIYLTAVAISGLSGFYIALFATGGLVAAMGFIALAIGWTSSSWLAYRAIQRMDLDQHQYWMIRSYAFCWAAVMLRIWLPLSQVLGIEFIMAYRIIAWLCWIPNLMVAEMIIHNLKLAKPKTI